MTTILYQYTPEILNIAAVNDVGHETAANMFVNNIDDIGNTKDQYYYHGADHLDYAALKHMIPPKGTQARADMFQVWDVDFDAHIAEISDFRDADNNEGLREFMLKLAAEHKND